MQGKRKSMNLLEEEKVLRRDRSGGNLRFTQVTNSRNTLSQMKSGGSNNNNLERVTRKKVELSNEAEDDPYIKMIELCMRSKPN